MDSRFLEFIGHLFLNAARSQQMLSQMHSWMGSAAPGNAALSDLFRKAYSLQRLPEGDADQAAWQKARESFQSSLESWWELMAVVPRSEYRTLEKKVKSLEEKLADRERTIRRLRRTASAEAGAPVAAVDAFTRLMEKQADEFQDLMQNLTRAFDSSDK